MKKHHPDEDAIPTLNDLVFPGERELRRPSQQQHERIDPQLPPDTATTESESEEYAQEETGSEPFILLPDEEDALAGWEFPSRTPAGRHNADEATPHLEEPNLPALALVDEDEDELSLADDSGQPPTESPFRSSEQASDVEPNTFAEAQPPQSNTESAHIAADDLPPVSNNSQQSPALLGDVHLEPTEQASSPSPEILPPEPDYDLVRTAVRNVLESELDRLTDVVTDAVIARLRE